MAAAGLRMVGMDHLLQSARWRCSDYERRRGDTNDGFRQKFVRRHDGKEPLVLVGKPSRKGRRRRKLPHMMRIGLLGASRIAPRAIIQPAADHPDAEIVAVGARDPAKAEAYAAEHGIPAAVGSYQELVERDDVDLVYCGLPPSIHLDTCRAASAAGKMLLIEKPFAFDAAAARAIAAAADAAGRPALEAYHYRFHSLFRRAEALLKDGAIGRVTRARGEFEAEIARAPGELRWMPEMGGGGTMDLGCYVLHAFRTLLGEGEVLAATSDQVDGVDATLEADLRFGDVEAWMR